MIAERWITAPGWVKALSLLGASGLLFAAMEYVVIQPRQARLPATLQAHHQARSKVTQLRQKIMTLTMSTNRIIQAGNSTVVRPFSLTDLLSRSGADLQRWSPENQPATLEVRIAWEKLPAIFVILSGYVGITLRAFSIEPEGDRLNLTLNLDVNHGS